MGGQQVLRGPRSSTHGVELGQEALRVPRRFERGAVLGLSAFKFILHSPFSFFNFFLIITYLYSKGLLASSNASVTYKKENKIKCVM